MMALRDLSALAVLGMGHALSWAARVCLGLGRRLGGRAQPTSQGGRR